MRLRIIHSGALLQSCKRPRRCCVPEVLHSDVSARQVVGGDVGGEEALNLTAVQVDGNHSVYSHGFQQARDIRGRDRYACTHLAVLPRIPIIRDYCGDSPVRGTHVINSAAEDE